MLKIFPSIFSQEFPQISCLATYFALQGNFPVMLVLSTIIILQHCYKNFIA